MATERIKRFGTIITNASIDYKIVEDMNWKYYRDKLSKYEKEKNLLQLMILADTKT